MRQDVSKVIQNGTMYVDDVFSTVTKFPWHHKNYYSEWLAQTYFYVSHTTRMLALATSKFSINEKSFHMKFIELINEEKGHEKLAEFDLKQLGFATSSFAELPETSAIYHALSHLAASNRPPAARDRA